MKNLVFKFLRYSGIPLLLRETLQRNRTTILMFHDITVSTAAQSFDFLRRHYNIIGLDHYIEAKINNLSLPPKSLVITFDDGHIDNYLLLPLLKKWNIPITIFLCSGIIDTNRHYWFLNKKLGTNKEALKKLPSTQKWQELAALGFNKKEEHPYPQALSRSQIKEMTPWINFQSHTIYHPCLPQCTLHDCKHELGEAKRNLEAQYHFTINAIAYPNGDYTDREMRIAQEEGYHCGLTTKSGYNTEETNLFELKRMSTNDTEDLNELIVKTSGLWGILKNIIRTRKLKATHANRNPIGLSAATN